jgi:2-oxoisovalerate dehydrogenase E1 component
VFFEISGAGHEALGVGLARHLRPAHDWFFPYYRDLALVLGLGVSPYETLLQAVGAADDPASGGRMMPAHWGDAKYNIVTQSSPTGSQILGAVGCAEASRYIVTHPGLPGCVANGDELTYVSLGEGACSEGEVWEGLNTACTLKLPLFIVVADNGWAISVPARDQAAAPIDQLLVGFRGLNIFHVDGGDYFSVRRVGAQAIEWVRSGRGPALLHAKVTRPYSHSSADAQSKYRPADELADEARRDPLVLMGRTLVEAGALTEAEVERIKAEARDEIANIARRAIEARRPDPLTVADHIYVLPVREETVPATDGEPMGFGDTINRTLHDIMAVDERVRVFGEDVADAPPELLDMVEGKGGVFGTTRGLQRKFGSDRCYNTPLAEANIIGRADGQANPGAAPVSRDPVLRLHLAGDAADQERSGDDPVALQRRFPRSRRHPRRDRWVPDGRFDLAQPERRFDLCPHTGSVDRVPFARGRRCRGCCGTRSSAKIRCSSSSTSICCATVRARPLSRRGAHRAVRQSGATSRRT